MPLSTLLSRLRRLWEHEIWAAGITRERNARSRLLGILRIVSITLSGLNELKVASRAAALTYSSLLGLGPLVALAVLISGFALGDQDPVLIARSLNRIISFIAPSVDQYQQAITAEQADGRGKPAPGSIGAPVAKPGPAAAPAAPEMVKLINNFITSSRSGTAGVVGLLALLVVVVLLFTNVENTFNDIWGVRRGRSWLARIVYYWTVVTLGAILFFTALTLFSAGTFLKVFFDWLPFHEELAGLSSLLLPSASALSLILLLSVFYRLVPNTRVKWRAAFIGALIVTGLLFLNNYLAFVYFRNVMSTKSLYGSVGILPILMLGLYVFWFFVLVGGQITYAVQNAHYRSSQTAWHSLNHVTREGMSLLVLLLIARRFKVCAPAYSVTQLAHLIRVPSQILNESLNRLCDLGLITELPPGEGADPTDHRYQPARPLDRITLADFRILFEQYGEAPSGALLDTIDPVLAHYRARLAAAVPQAFGDQTIDQLLDAHEPRETYAPFPTK